MEKHKTYLIGEIPIWENHDIEVVKNHYLSPEILSTNGYDLMVYFANNIQDNAKALGADTVLVHTLTPTITCALVLMEAYQQFYLHWGIVDSRLIKPTVNSVKLLSDGRLPPSFYALMKNASKLEITNGKAIATGKIVYTCHNIHWLH